MTDRETVYLVYRFEGGHLYLMRNVKTANYLLDLSAEEAQSVVDEYTAKGHRQTYDKLGYPRGDFDIAMRDNEIELG